MECSDCEFVMGKLELRALHAHAAEYKASLENLRDRGPCPDHDCDCHVSIAAKALEHQQSKG